MSAFCNPPLSQAWHLPRWAWTLQGPHRRRARRQRQALRPPLHSLAPRKVLLAPLLQRSAGAGRFVGGLTMLHQTPGILGMWLRRLEISARRRWQKTWRRLVLLCSTMIHLMCRSLGRDVWRSGELSVCVNVFRSGAEGVSSLFSLLVEISADDVSLTRLAAKSLRLSLV